MSDYLISKRLQMVKDAVTRLQEAVAIGRLDAQGIAKALNMDEANIPHAYAGMTGRFLGDSESLIWNVKRLIEILESEKSSEV